MFLSVQYLLVTGVLLLVGWSVIGPLVLPFGGLALALHRLQAAHFAPRIGLSIVFGGIVMVIGLTLVETGAEPLISRETLQHLAQFRWVHSTVSKGAAMGDAVLLGEFRFMVAGIVGVISTALGMIIMGRYKLGSWGGASLKDAVGPIGPVRLLLVLIFGGVLLSLGPLILEPGSRKYGSAMLLMPVNLSFGLLIWTLVFNLVIEGLRDHSAATSSTPMKPPD